MAEDEIKEHAMPDDVAEAVERGREAAVECVNAVHHLCEAVMQHSGESQATFHHEPLSRLYEALRNGWGPICQCWPELRRPIGNGEAIESAETQSPPPVLVWFVALQIFWLTVNLLGHTMSAVCAWKEWSDTYQPDEEFDYLGIDLDAQWQTLQEVVPQVWRPDTEGPMISLIRQEMPSAEDINAGETQIQPPSLDLIPSKPLPQSRRGLERLLDSFYGVIQACQSAGVKLFTVLRTLHSGREPAGRNALARIPALSAELSDVSASFSPTLLQYIGRSDLYILMRDDRDAYGDLESLAEMATEIASREGGKVFSRRVIEAITRIASVYGRYLDFLEQQRNRVEVELDKLDSVIVQPQEQATDQLPLPDNLFRKKGNQWQIRYAGGELFSMGDAVGLFYIAYLLDRPKEDVTPLQLWNEHPDHRADPESQSHSGAKQRSESPDESAKSHVTHGGEMVDKKALRQYKNRLGEIRMKTAEAKQEGDYGKVAELQNEHEFIRKEVRSATNLGGDPKVFSDKAKNVTDAVRNAIDRSIAKIEKTDPKLWQHLDNAVHRKPPPYSYRFEEPIDWVT